MNLELLYAHAADLGLTVDWADLGHFRRGEYRDDERRILLNERLTHAQAVSTLAHELGHAYYGDRTSTPALERRAWAYAARLMITPLAYARAESIVGEHPNALAAELGVSQRLVKAWRDSRTEAELVPYGGRHGDE